MTNHMLDHKLKSAYDALSEINKKAYRDIFLIPNQVLSKNPFTNNFLRRLLNNENPKWHSVFKIYYKLFKYYIVSFVHFVRYISEFVAYFLSAFRFTPSRRERELVLVDTFFLVKRITDSKEFEDIYFPGLENLLKNMNMHFAYLARFYGHESPFDIYRVLRILKKKRIPVITEYQLLSLYELLHLLYFLMAYPLHLLKFIKTLGSDTEASRLIKYELIDNLDQITFRTFSRYLQGKKIGRFQYDSIKLISWYENQVIDKTLYKGLRTCGCKVKIYGMQLFLSAKSDINVIADENESNFDLVPDKIIVNGSYYIPERTGLNYSVGPSLRYAKIFNVAKNKEKRKDILILLPYYEDDVENILRIVIDAKIDSRNIFIKPHPATPIQKYKHLVSPKAKLVNMDVYELFAHAKIVISAASTTLLEAATLGIAAISVINKKRMYYNPFPEHGKDLIWAEVESSEELFDQIKQFEEMLDNNMEEIDRIADSYKKMFFCKPTEDGIIEAIELKR